MRLGLGGGDDPNAEATVSTGTTMLRIFDAVAFNALFGGPSGLPRFSHSLAPSLIGLVVGTVGPPCAASTPQRSSGRRSERHKLSVGDRDLLPLDFGLSRRDGDKSPSLLAFRPGGFSLLTAAVIWARPVVF